MGVEFVEASEEVRAAIDRLIGRVDLRSMLTTADAEAFSYYNKV